MGYQKSGILPDAIAILIPQFQGKNNPERPDHFLCHFPHSHRSSYFTTYRKGDWKLIYRYRTTGNAEQRANKDKKALPKYELYNLKDDPYEETNLTEQKPNKLKTMMKQMIDQLETENAVYVIDSSKIELKPVLP